MATAKKLIFFRRKNVLKQLDTDSVYVLEGFKNYVRFYIYEEVEVFTIRTTLEIAIAQMPKNKFIQVHRSYAINTDFIDEFNRETLKLKYVRGEIPVSKVFYPEMIKRIVILDAESQKSLSPYTTIQKKKKEELTLALRKKK